jgi:hypothetical protein
MNNKHWEAELSDAVKGMEPVQPPLNMRTAVMQQIRSMEATRPMTVRPLLSASIRKIILISIPALMAVALLLSPQTADTSGSIIENIFKMIPEIQQPDIPHEMSDTIKLALMAVLVFSFLQVVNIGRLISRADKRLH